MFKFFKNNYNLRRSLYTLFVVIVAILFYRITENVQVNNFFPIILSVLSPFIIGIIIAYIVNCMINFLERRVLIKIKYFRDGSPKARKLGRKLSILISFIFLIGLIVGIISYIIPEIVRSINDLVNYFVSINYKDITRVLDSIMLDSNISIGPDFVRDIFNSLTEFFRGLADSLKYIPDMIGSIISMSINVASGVVKAVMGIIISIYILLDKEEIVALGKKIIRALFSNEVCSKMTMYVKEMNHTFNHFFIGKLMDSLIIGLIFYIVSIIFGFPYASLCAIIIGITNMIPYFGPFIGSVPVVLLTLLVEIQSPLTALWVIITIVILQQFDSIFLEPKIVGGSLDLKPISVIFAITVGGAIAGPLGMFFGVPVFSVISKFAMIAIESHYNKKQRAALKKEKEENGEKPKS